MIDFHQICNVFSFFVAEALSFLLLSASLYLFQHSHDTSIGMGNDVPHFAEVLFILIILFVFCPLVCVVPIHLTSTSLILLNLLVPLVNFSFQFDFSTTEFPFGYF